MMRMKGGGMGGQDPVGSISITSDTNIPMRWLLANDKLAKLSSVPADSCEPEIHLDIKESRFQRRIKRWKRDARGELDARDWSRARFASLNFNIPDHLDTVARIDVDQVSYADFVARFERDGVPAVLTGVVRDWDAQREWTPQRLLERFHGEKFKVGEDDDGDPVYVQFSYFMHYCLNGEAARDDSPLYIFDPNFGDRKRSNTALDIAKKRKNKKKKKGKETESGAGGGEGGKDVENEGSESGEGVARKKAKMEEDLVSEEPRIPPVSLKLNLEAPKSPALTPASPTPLSPTDTFPPSKPTCEMLADYKIPRYFRDDLFQYTGSRRPPHRWVVIGPKRSGTGIHVDPLGTSAWNTLVFGHKRWALFPPTVPKHMVTMRGMPDHEAATWFVMVYPRLHDSSTIDASGKALAERL
ncbi:jumonji domain-containing protein 6 [Chytriomyces hyalinus]|nr:jumonji domain-containing protein 6 [Chytriomyces hyalinus]